MVTQTAGPQVGEVGLKFILSTEIDLTAFTTFKINARKPHGPTKVWVAAVEGAATDGKISYTTIAGDLSHRGLWVLQAQVEDGAGAVLFGEAVEVLVKDPFEV